MKAMILAAGLGKRLGALSDQLPKCLQDVGGKAMLEIVAERLKACGVTEIVINLHHHADQVRRFVTGKNSFGVKVHFSPEEALLDTGGGIKKARVFLDGTAPFLVHNADVYTDADLGALYRDASDGAAIAALAVMDRPTSRPLLFDPSGQLVGKEKPGPKRDEVIREMARECADPAKLAFSGVHVLSPRIFALMEGQGDTFSIIDTYLRAVRGGASVAAHRIDKFFWTDIGTPESLERLRAIATRSPGKSK